jgi:xylulose-5-phosphate/fructose-6-phosphate phosphoketolase
VARPATSSSEATRVLGTFLREVMRLNSDVFRVVGPDETASNCLGALFDVTARTWLADSAPGSVLADAHPEILEVDCDPVVLG